MRKAIFAVAIFGIILLLIMAVMIAYDAITSNQPIAANIKDYTIKDNTFLFLTIEIINNSKEDMVPAKAILAIATQVEEVLQYDSQNDFESLQPGESTMITRSFKLKNNFSDVCIEVYNIFDFKAGRLDYKEFSIS